MMLKGAEKLPDIVHLSTVSHFIITDNFLKDTESKYVGYDCVTDPLFYRWVQNEKLWILTTYVKLLQQEN
jgi:hypothetical protein